MHLQSHWAPCAFAGRMHPHTNLQSRCPPQLFSPIPGSFVCIVYFLQQTARLSVCARQVCHETRKGIGLLESHGLSETPIVWRNTSLGVARGIRILVGRVNQFRSPFAMCVPCTLVPADNPSPTTTACRYSITLSKRREPQGSVRP